MTVACPGRLSRSGQATCWKRRGEQGATLRPSALAVLKGIDSGDGGSYRCIAEPDQLGSGAFRYVPGQSPTNRLLA